MILAFNTSTRQSSIALLKTNCEIVAEYLMFEGKGHFGGLMPAVDMLVAGAHLNRKDIQCVSVATGPGSFTGLRVGLSLAKGICHALRVPLIGISSLRALAFQVPFTLKPVAPILTSRRGEVFTALFLWNQKNNLERIRKDSCLRLDDLLGYFGEKPVFVGNDYSNHGKRLLELLDDHTRVTPPQHWNLRASSIGALAAARFLKGDSDDPGGLIPRYFRPPDIRSQTDLAIL
jgi:tRNA threonylcarbamoyladenosine biosynthesis protein TsaB